jgi:GNAT superfamily N-acetyltransferase
MLDLLGYGVWRMVKIQQLQSDEEWSEAISVIQVLRPTLTKEVLLLRKSELQEDGYRLLGAFSDGSLVAVASYTVSPHIILGRELLIHDMATRIEAQGKGYASALLRELERIAKECGCGRVFVHTRNASIFYGLNHYQEYSTGMIKILS